MRRAVVVGPYPPTADPLGDVTLARVRELRSEGYAVEVVSPAPSAARRHLRPDTVCGRWRLARVTRGVDLVVMIPTGDRQVSAPLRGRASMARVRGRAQRLRAGAPTLVRTGLGRLRRR